MMSFLDSIKYFRSKYEIFNLLEELHNYVSNHDLSKIKIKENNLEEYSNKKSKKFDVVMFHSQINEFLQGYPPVKSPNAGKYKVFLFVSIAKHLRDNLSP